MTREPSQPSRRHKRNLEAIAADVRATARSAASQLGLDDSRRSAVHGAPRVIADGQHGLLLGELEENRWKVSRQTAAEKLRSAGLPVEGRRAKLIYSWPSILRAEGLDQSLAGAATRKTHPGLFEALLTGDEAAQFIGVHDGSTIRRMVATGVIQPSAYVIFGSRGMRRYRRSGLEGERLRRLEGRLV